MKIIVLSMLVACAVGMSKPRTNFEAEWKSWKIEHGKSYKVEEELKRQMIWEQNRHFVMKHNYEYDLGKHTYTTGMNKFADMTNEEFKALYMSERPRDNKRDCRQGTSSNTTNPTSEDWTKKGYVTPVKNQLQCGSCWAFSTTGSVEGQFYKNTGRLVSLSEQNLVDCSTPEGDMGCNGGLMDYAFDYIKEEGIESEASYPYEAVQRSCRFKKDKVVATLTGCVDIPSMDEHALETAVAYVGPISVAIDASHTSFQLYNDGIYYEPSCSQVALDHGVLAVGYGSSSGQNYWLVKNSWGADWGGRNGYIRMAKDRNNNCGIATSASYPTGVRRR